MGGDGDDSISLSYKDLSQTSHDPPPTTAAPHSNSDQAMRIELERSQSQIKDLEMSRSSLRSEVDRLKSLLEVAADCCPQVWIRAQYLFCMGFLLDFSLKFSEISLFGIKFALLKN